MRKKKKSQKLNPMLFEQTPEEIKALEEENDDTPRAFDGFVTEAVDYVRDNVELFHTSDSIPYATISVDGRNRTVELKNELFSNYLSKLLYENFGTVSTKYYRDRIVDTLAVLANYEYPEADVHLRTYYDRVKNELWYDLGNGYVHVTKVGWSIQEKSPVKFRSTPLQIDQCLPVTGGSIDDFFELLNIKNDSEKLLLKTYLVGVLVPDIARPMVAVFGSQGSSKTTMQRLIKKLVDPTKAELCSYPSKQESLQILMNNEYVVCFDNMTKLSHQQSDELARSITGQSTANRELYSNKNLVVFNYTRAVCLNGINLVAVNPDLLDRSMLIETERISEDQWLPETEISAIFDEIKPNVLGAIFDALSKTLRLIEEKPIESIYRGRLGAYTEFCQYAALALGEDAEDFVKAFKENVSRQNEEAIKSDPLALAIIDFMKDQNEITMQPSKLHAELKEKYGDSSLPRGAQALSKGLNALKTTLANVGIGVEIMREQTRIIRIYRL